MYNELKKVVKDLLTELRIDENCLDAMASGYSPELLITNPLYYRKDWNPCPKVQLSQDVSKRSCGHPGHLSST